MVCTIAQATVKLANDYIVKSIASDCKWRNGRRPVFGVTSAAAAARKSTSRILS